MDPEGSADYEYEEQESDWEAIDEDEEGSVPLSGDDEEGSDDFNEEDEEGDDGPYDALSDMADGEDEEGDNNGASAEVGGGQADDDPMGLNSMDFFKPGAKRHEEDADDDDQGDNNGEEGEDDFDEEGDDDEEYGDDEGDDEEGDDEGDYDEEDEEGREDSDANSDADDSTSKPMASTSAFASSPANAQDRTSAFGKPAGGQSAFGAPKAAAPSNAMSAFAARPSTTAATPVPASRPSPFGSMATANKAKMPVSAPSEPAQPPPPRVSNSQAVVQRREPPADPLPATRMRQEAPPARPQQEARQPIRAALPTRGHPSPAPKPLTVSKDANGSDLTMPDADHAALVAMAASLTFIPPTGRRPPAAVPNSQRFLMQLPTTDYDAKINQLLGLPVH